MSDTRYRFPVGTRFHSAGKHPVVCTVTDIHFTANLAGETVSVRYVATHTFLGQTVTEFNVCDTSIARRLIPTP
jgi:hypothetical protein